MMEWIQTCQACPEQYDIFDGPMQVGYFRLRHGTLTVTCPGVCGKVVYKSSDFAGDGMFEKNEERTKHLSKAEEAIKAWKLSTSPKFGEANPYG